MYNQIAQDFDLPECKYAHSCCSRVPKNMLKNFEVAGYKHC